MTRIPVRLASLNKVPQRPASYRLAFLGEGRNAASHPRLKNQDSSDIVELVHVLSHHDYGNQILTFTLQPALSAYGCLFLNYTRT